MRTFKTYPVSLIQIIFSFLTTIDTEQFMFSSLVEEEEINSMNLEFVKDATTYYMNNQAESLRIKKARYHESRQIVIVTVLMIV